jgi:DNA polymerase III subunit alpha
LCYCLGITAIDPLRFDLVFSRFISEERNDWPDIDIDFAHDRRAEVKAYAVSKYPSVGNIATFSFFRDKGTIKDAARALSINLTETEAALKNIPAENGFELFEESPDTADYRHKYPEVLELARSLRGRIRGTGLHAAGVVVSSKPLEDYMPIESRTDNSSKDKSRLPVIAYDMEEVAAIGAIKIDFLGLKNLTMIEDCIQLVKERTGKVIDLDYKFDDPAIYNDLSNGFTVGVFQAEQPAYTKLLKEMGVEGFADLAASNALVRPGAANTVGKDYIARKNRRALVARIHPIYDEVTAETYGVVIYQEQVMRLCVELAGMSWSEADKIRKIIGKKKDVSEFHEYQAKFVEGASEHITEAQALDLWHTFEAHAGYSFNKSHAVAYSAISYWTTWLKHYYPLEFLTSVLRYQDDVKDCTPYFVEAKRLGFSVILPDINASPIYFQPEGESKIRYPLSRPKGMSDVTATVIVNNRPYKTYADFEELVAREKSGISKAHEKALNAVGAIKVPGTMDTAEMPRVRENFYNHLGLPSFDTSAVTQEMLNRVLPSDRWNEEGIGIMIGMAKKVTHKATWARAEFVDQAGPFSGFISKSAQIVEGNMYLVMLSGNSVSRYMSLSDIKDRQHDPLIQYLTGAVEVPDRQYYVLSFNAKRSKKNTDYAECVLLNSRGEARKVMVFGKMFPYALAHAKPGALVHLKVKKMEDETLMMKEIEPVEVD